MKNGYPEGLPIPYKSFAITAVTLAAIVITIPIFKQVSAKPPFNLGIVSNENPQPTQDATRPSVIFLQLGHCLDMIRPPLRRVLSLSKILKDVPGNFKGLLR